MLNPQTIDLKLTALFIGTKQWRAAKALARRKRVSGAAIVREALDVYLAENKE